jgi:hypothetical protein
VFADEEVPNEPVPIEVV